MTRLEKPMIEVLTDFCCQYYDKELSDEVMLEAKISLIDYFSSLLWGTDSEYFRFLLRYAEKIPEGNSMVIGLNKKSTVVEAAFINSIVSHSMEIDDIHLGTTGLHPGVTIIPSVIALAEELGSSGKDVLKAIVIGYEVAGRIGKSISPSHRYRGFHATGTIGVFGSAAATAFLKKLPPKKFIHALSLASSQAGGTFAFLAGGVGVKYLHAGNASKNGIQSTMLAELGFTGPESFLEHNEGFANAYSSEYNLDLVTKSLGNSFEIKNIFRKMYFICGHIFPTIEALPKNIRLIDLDDIVAINIYTYKAASVLMNRRPANFSEAKFSIPYCISSFYLFNEVKDCFKDKDLLETVFLFSKKINIYEENKYTNHFPHKRCTRVEFILNSDKVEKGYVEFPKGTPNNPYTIDEISEKLISSLDNMGNKKVSNDLLGHINTLERHTNLTDMMNIFNEL